MPRFGTVGLKLHGGGAARLKKHSVELRLKSVLLDTVREIRKVDEGSLTIMNVHGMIIRTRKLREDPMAAAKTQLKGRPKVLSVRREAGLVLL